MIWKKLLLLSLIFTTSFAYGAVEDFDTYTEQDADNKITITTTRVASNGADPRQADYWVYDDKLAGHFGDYEHLATISWDGSVNAQLFSWWGVSNIIGDHFDWEGNDFQTVYTYSTDEDIRYRDETGGVDTYATSAGLFYITVKRTGTTGTCKVYSDFARTDLLATLSLTVTNTTFRYVYAYAGYNNGTSSNDMGPTYVENLDLQEVAPPTGYGQVIGIMIR